MTLLCAAVLLVAGCTERKPLGVECTFNGDCEDDLICAGGFCRAQCRDDRDCLRGWRCVSSGQVGKSVCLPPDSPLLCVASVTCPPASRCAPDKVCYWTCSGNPDCVARAVGATCRPDVMLCTEPVRVGDLGAAPTPDAGTDATPDAAADDLPATDAPSLDADVPAAADVPATDAAAPDAPAPDVPPTACETRPDGDGDGYPAVACGGRDCDDARRDVNPVALEVCDGADNDCDGMTDEDASTQCALANASSAACMGGRCAVATCLARFGDCDGVAANGCETDTRASPAHCGGCGRACPAAVNAATMACRDGACGVGACLAGWGDCDSDQANGCEAELRSDARSCGRCGEVCPSRAHGAAACRDGACALACEAGWADCDGVATNGCEVALLTDRASCGLCRRACAGAEDVCVRGSCLPHPYASTGAEGAFDPAEDVVLAAGVHHYTTVRVRRGVTVRTDGTGALELWARGDVVIDGTIDVSGGAGGDSIQVGMACGGNGGGGATGTTAAGARGAVGVCQSSGAGGGGAAGDVGNEAGGSCGTGGRYGGGAGGAGGRSGGGGGGVAGGGGGASTNDAGGAGGGVSGASAGGAGGNNVAMARRGGQGGEPTATAPYRGGDGTARCTEMTLHGTGAGGGSIGAAAIADLAVRATFQPGSGGGGGAGAGSCFYGAAAGGGGGGGGGALRLASPTRITVSGALLARGGAGGAAAYVGFSGGGHGAAGGGGSGGVIYLSTPSLAVTGMLSAAGGAAGAATGSCGGHGGAGGLGRIRLSTLPEGCALAGEWTPALASGCALTPSPGTAGRVYVGAYPE